MKQVIWILLLAGFLALSLSGLIPLPKTKSNLPQPSPLQNAQILPKYADVMGQNLQLASFEVIGEVKPVCQVGGKIAIDLLLDTSGSMKCEYTPRGRACKINSLKTAVNNFIDQLPDDTLIGIQTLRAKFQETNTLANIGKEALKAKISAMEADGSTPTQDGLEFAQTALAKAKTVFPDYKNQVLLVLTDGCPDQDQKPIRVAKEIKNSGARIMTIGIELGTGGDKKCPDGYSGAIKIMESISSPGDYADATAANLNQILNEVLGKTASCQTAQPVCIVGQRPAVNLLIDTSSTMEPYIGALRAALSTFASSFKDTDVVGMQTFSGGSSQIPYINALPIGVYANNKSQFNQAILALSVDPNGLTYMKSAVSFAKSKIDSYRAVPSYRNWAFIFLSDGFPQTKTSNGLYDPNQDPTADITAMKARGMRVITIALGPEADKTLMKKLASNETNDYFEATSASDLNTIFPQLFQSFDCNPTSSPNPNPTP